MGDQSSASTNFRELFESALQTYDKMTGMTLAEHPFSLRLRNCPSVESVIALLQDQVITSSNLRGSDRIMKSIKSTISILSTLSATAALDWATVLVCPKALMACSMSITVFRRHSHLKMPYTLVSLSY